MGAAMHSPPGPERDDLAAAVRDRLVRAYPLLAQDADAYARLAGKIAANEQAAKHRQRTRRERIRRVVARGKATAAGGEEPTEDAALRAAMSEALDALTSEERLLLQLRVDAGLTFAQTAEVLGVPQSTVHGRFAAMMRRLRATLADRAANDETLAHALRARGYP